MSNQKLLEKVKRLGVARPVRFSVQDLFEVSCLTAQTKHTISIVRLKELLAGKEMTLPEVYSLGLVQTLLEVTGDQSVSLATVAQEMHTVEEAVQKAKWQIVDGVLKVAA